jgi:hypothetical protein
MPPYNGTFKPGSKVQVVDRQKLEEFMRTWKFHNKLREEQLDYADRVLTVLKVAYYHGGDPLYVLQEVRGVYWHEQCLREPDAAKAP